MRVIMLKIITVCLFVVFVYAKQNDSSEFPSDLQKCHRGDNECIQNALQYIIKTYPHGNPTLNLPSLEPLRFPKFNVVWEEEGNEELRISLKAKNIEVTGFASPNTKYSIGGFEKDIASSNVTIKIEVPLLNIENDHQLKLKFKKRPLHGKGRSKVVFKDIDYIMNFIPTIFTKDGKEYLKIKTLTLDYIPRNVEINFGDLFDGDKDLSDKEHTFLNEHGVNFFQQLRKIVGAEWVPIFTEIIDSLFAKFPLDELFLD